MMRAGRSRAHARPNAWYRHAWPWLLMLPPAAAVAGGITMIWLATHTQAALVVEDYARIEEITAQRFDQDARAANIGLSADLRIERPAHDAAQMTIQLHSATAADLPGALQLRLRHVTAAELDRDVLARRLGNEYRASVGLGAGAYLLEIAPPDGAWRLAARLRETDRRMTLTAGDRQQ